MALRAEGRILGVGNLRVGQAPGGTGWAAALESIAADAGRFYDPDAVAACLMLFERGYHIDAADMRKLDWLAKIP